MKYPVSEEETPWDQWHGEGNIQFIKAPTQAELIVTYYEIAYGIDVLDKQAVEDCDPGFPVASIIS